MLQIAVLSRKLIAAARGVGKVIQHTSLRALGGLTAASADLHISKTMQNACVNPGLHHALIAPRWCSHGVIFQEHQPDGPFAAELHKVGARAALNDSQGTVSQHHM
ncbi:hypothetical protein WJX74_007228 [Apatococcus lobatus]|uniref:Uncharacterized protein n=1 Tax=Apatococcus lobatus TaxID=904363 RepID=A0AAW1R3P4_9CHLO